MLRKRSNGSQSFHLETLEPRQLLAGDTYLVNFQNDEASVPTGYVRDIGLEFGARGDGLTFGWSSDHTDQSRERSAVPDQRLDTLIHVEAGEVWEFALTNGSYEVTVAVGDPDNNDGLHTVNIEGVNYWTNQPDTDNAQQMTMQVSVADGRLTLDVGAAGEKDTRVNFIHIVGVNPGNPGAPGAPLITEPSFDGQEVNPADVHMEAILFNDPNGDSHQSTDWEIWTTGASPVPVWQTLGIQGVERLHTHLGDGIFLNDRAGEITLDENTDYELRARFRDDTGSVSAYSTRLFSTAAASVTFPLQLEDIAETPTPEWLNVLGVPVDLPTAAGILSPSDPVIAFDSDEGTDSASPGGEQAFNVLDGDSGTKYLNFAEFDTGFIVTPSASSVIRSFRITTANDAVERDPDAYIIYGTNDPITSSAHGNGRDENWTLISSGGLSLPNAREAVDGAENFANNQSYTSYKVVFPTVKNPGNANSMQLADFQLYTNTTGSGGGLLAPGDFIIPIQDVDGGPSSGSPVDEGPASAIDGSANTKYLNTGAERSGLIVTPSNPNSVATSFRITTANDAEGRDPSAWEIYGTNSPINSTNHGFGDGEPWTLIDFGTVDLPLARNTDGPVVAIDNDTAYSSYKIVFTELRDPNVGDMQIAEIQLFGEGQQTGTPPSLRLEDGATGDPLLDITGTDAAGNITTDYPGLSEHVNLRVVIASGSQALNLTQSDLSITEANGQQHTIFLPSVTLDPMEELELWVSSSGATYFADPGELVPDFSDLAREANLDIPYVTTQPGYVIEEVGNDYRLPVNITFVPNPGPNHDDPLYYVTELYGSIQVVTRDGTKHEFATALLDYNPTGPISGSGEQGLTGLAVMRDEVDPEIYHLYVGMLADNGDPPGGAVHYPKVEHITSTAGGLSMDTRDVLLNMQPETQGQSHQISNVTIGPDGMLYVHNGDGFNASTAQDLDQYRGKVLRMTLDGDAPSDNPFYDAGDGITARDYVWAYGLRNPFGGAWRASDGTHYQVENGPSVDRFSQVNEGVNYLWDGSNASMQNFAIYNWNPSTAPVNITFVQPETFNGSAFPVEKQDHAFISESGPTYAQGAQANGKRVTEFVLDENGDLVDGPTSLVEYVGNGHASVVALAAGPDGLYFSTLYEDSGDSGPTASGARIFRVRYVNPQPGDYDIDGDVDQDDYNVWKSTFGSNLLLAADGNGNGRVDLADYTIWRNHLGAGVEEAAAIEASPVVAAVQTATTETSLLASYSRAEEPSGLLDLVEQGDSSSHQARGGLVSGPKYAGSAPDQSALLLVLNQEAPHRDATARDLALAALGDTPWQRSTDTDFDDFFELDL
ncbi:PQQ-dependent sugar dehydrogenase [Aeoliella sp.]|uniref:PQQ-dependent sugar dehydrogenase n=1 Tax=Aeoliella sp. TaxID=2795800 RepID=UPI003CCBCCD3